MTSPIDLPIDPHIHSTTHTPIGGGVSTNHKSSIRIELFQLGQVLFDI